MGGNIENHVLDVLLLYSSRSWKSVPHSGFRAYGRYAGSGIALVRHATHTQQQRNSSVLSLWSELSASEKQGRRVVLTH